MKVLHAPEHGHALGLETTDDGRVVATITTPATDGHTETRAISLSEADVARLVAADPALGEVLHNIRNPGPEGIPAPVVRK